jgi:RNA polymerase sigma factor (sigma-70 family)
MGNWQDEARTVRSITTPLSRRTCIDADWLNAYRTGQREALESVYWTYISPMKSYLRSLARLAARPDLGQESSVADFVQEVFSRTFSSTARRCYDGQRDFGGYVNIIARNCFVDALRTRQRETKHARAAWNERVEELVPPLDESVDPRIHRALAEYLVGLTSELRQVYECRFALGHSQQEACATLGISRRTLRTRESHLIKGLRRALTKGGVSLAELRPTGRTRSIRNQRRRSL